MKATVAGVEMPDGTARALYQWNARYPPFTLYNQTMAASGIVTDNSTLILTDAFQTPKKRSASGVVGAECAIWHLVTEL